MDGPKLLRDFGTLVSPLLLRVQGTKVHVPCLDQTVVEPLRCDPMTIVAPPPRLLTYSDLEGFLSAQRIRPFLLLRARLLDFICAPESTISSELDLFEGFRHPTHSLHFRDRFKLRSKVNDDRRFTGIAGSQHAGSLPGSSTSAIWKVLT
jgi:hypothetical protein